MSVSTRRFNPHDEEQDLTVVAVVGLGYWGPNLARVAADLANVKLKWVCDQDQERLDRLGRRYPGCLRTRDLDDILDDEEVDAVIVATPVFTHFDIAMASLGANKHTFVEKPLAPSADEAERLVEEAHTRELVLMCGHTFIYSPPVRKVKDLIESGELGDILFASSSRVNLGLHQRDVSVVWDLGPHDFSILQYWLGETPESVRAMGRASIVPGIADVAFVNLSYASGIVANVELSWLSPSKLRRSVIVGRDKMVVYDDGAQESVKIFDTGVEFKDPESFGEFQLSYRTGDVLSPKVDTYEPLHAELTDFASAIQSGTEPEANSELARAVVLVTEAADESLDQGGDLVLIESGDWRGLTLPAYAG